MCFFKLAPGILHTSALSTKNDKVPGIMEARGREGRGRERYAPIQALVGAYLALPSPSPPSPPAPTKLASTTKKSGKQKSGASWATPDFFFRVPVDSDSFPLQRRAGRLEALEAAEGAAQQREQLLERQAGVSGLGNWGF